MKLYKLSFDCGRMGVLDGIFLAEPEAVADAIGQEVYFGEALGKHSDVHGELDASEVTALDVSDSFVEEFRKNFPNGFGYNPLDHLGEEE